MKRNRQQNKKLQGWWSWHRYCGFAGRLFGAFAAEQIRIFSYVPKLRAGASTLIVFAFPVATALFVLLSVAVAYLLLRFSFCLAVILGLFFWMLLAGALHVMGIAAHRSGSWLSRQLLRRNRYVCPCCHIDIWTTRHRLPIYVCNTCGSDHYLLRPSIYGVRWHKCECNNKLAALSRERRDSLKTKCPNCFSPIDIGEFGRLPHAALAVLEGVPAAAEEFLETAWAGITGNGGVGLRVGQARVASTGAAGPPFPGSSGAGEDRTWVWTVSGAGRRGLLYLHESDVPEIGEGLAFFTLVSGIAFVLPISAIKRVDMGSDSEVDANALIAKTLQSLRRRFGSFEGRLEIPVAVIVPDSATAKPRAEIEEFDDYIVRLIKDNFVSVRYFGSGPDRAAAATKWLVSGGGRKLLF